MHQKGFVRLTVLALSLSVSAPLFAEQDLSSLSDRERIQRLERLVQSQGLVDLLMRLESLQQDVQQLRGDSDLQTRNIEDIKKRQRDLYIDIDRRLLQLERRSGGMAPPVAVTPPSTHAAPGSATTTTAPPAVAPQMVETDPEEEQKAYQKAFDLLRDLRYDQAMAAFRDFLKKYPDGRYAHIAQYWLGEAGYAQSQFATAIKDYQALINNYPNSPKLAQAMLKIGYSHYKLKNIKAARKSFEQVMKSFPGTTEAGQAEKMLKEIKSKR